MKDMTDSSAIGPPGRAWRRRWWWPAAILIVAAAGVAFFQAAPLSILESAVRFLATGGLIGLTCFLLAAWLAVGAGLETRLRWLPLVGGLVAVLVFVTVTRVDDFTGELRPI